MNIPVVLHEQNSVAGMANKYLAKRAAAVCLTYACSAQDMPATANCHVTGNPVRKSVIEAQREKGRALFNLEESDLMLLVFGGSLGARHINEALAACKDELLSRPHVKVVHITGPKELDRVKELMNLTSAEEERWLLLGYQDNMGETLAAADLIVSRAGATSLAEITARAIPAILIPYPYATADHQTTNAQSAVEGGGCVLIPDAEVGTPLFRDTLFDLIDNTEKREALKTAAQQQKADQAGVLLADVVVDVATSAKHS
jgi:UDP-N-acetylglucosamine--N-acetylmuramyl-(pentapeptide) pyrophosphoryl-undecaprenol N-acetylglucosamine transferase